MLACLLLVGCAWFIWGNSILSPAESNAQSELFTDFLARILGDSSGSASRVLRYMSTHVRKLAHAAEFAALGIAAAVILILLRRVNPHMVAHAFFLVLSVAVADEAIQIYTGRGAQVRDILLDFAGGSAGLAAALGIRALCVGLARR
jgi:VanZ family protein